MPKIVLCKVYSLIRIKTILEIVDKCIRNLGFNPIKIDKRANKIYMIGTNGNTKLTTILGRYNDTINRLGRSIMRIPRIKVTVLIEPKEPDLNELKDKLETYLFREIAKRRMGG